MLENLFKKPVVPEETIEVIPEEVPMVVIEEVKEESTKELTELEQSVIDLEKARAGRKHSNIPLGDSYWDALKIHQSAYTRHMDK